MAYQPSWVIYYQIHPFFKEGLQWYNLPHRWEDKGVHAFLMGICLKENVIAWLKFKLAYYDSVVQPLHHEDTLYQEESKVL